MKNAVQCVIIVSFGVVLTACSFVSGDSKEIDKMRTVVKGALIDGESAQFSDLKYYKSTNYGCGYVNAKNKLGGYVGKKKFIVSLDDNAVEIDPDRDLPEAPRAPSHVSVGSTIDYALESGKWMATVEEMRNRYQAFDTLVAEKCTDNPSSKTDHIQSTKKETAEATVQYVPYGEKDGFIAQYSDEYPLYAANISKMLAPELKNILSKKGVTETTVEFNKRSHYLTLEGKPFDLGAEYGLILLDGYSSADAIKGINAEYNADKGMLSVTSSSSFSTFCEDPGKDDFSKIPRGKEYGLTCSFNRYTGIIFSNKQTDVFKYLKRVDYSREKLYVSDSFKISKEKLMELPTSSYSDEKFHVGFMMVGRIHKDLSIHNFQDQARDYFNEAVPYVPFRITKIIYFNSKNGEILASRSIQ